MAKRKAMQRVKAKGSAKKPKPATRTKSKATVRKSSPRPTTQKAKAKAKEKPTLGRPKITGEELLYLLFREDFHAREVFNFLRVQTVKELERYTPQQIVKLLSKPITDTVDRIRSKLADKNRYLNNDSEFAIEYLRGARIEDRGLRIED